MLVFIVDQKFVYFQRFDEFFHCCQDLRIAEKTTLLIIVQDLIRLRD